MKFTKLIIALAAFFALAAAMAATKNKKNAKKEPSLKIVSTIFPSYDWAREILGEKASEATLTLLLDSGTDLHSYQPSFKDISKIASADVFIYVGGESDNWVPNVLKTIKNPNLKTINLLETLGSSAKEEEIVEGMQSEEEESDEIELDEHVWLSLKNSKTLVSAISEAIALCDSKNATLYKANAIVYEKRLSDLDKAFENALKECSKSTLVFADRFPFRYLVDDYSLSYYAAFAGCSAETEASFETVVFLSKKIDELSSNAVFQIESSDGKIAKTVIKNSQKNKNATIFVLDSMQSTTAKDAQNGKTYLSVMKKNLEVLKEALK